MPELQFLKALVFLDLFKSYETELILAFFVVWNASPSSSLMVVSSSLVNRKINDGTLSSVENGIYC